MPEPRKILLVEDNRADAVLLGDMLMRDDPGLFDLNWDERLDKALDRLHREPFDAILLDLSLPDSQGLDTIRQINAAAPTTPILIVTGLTDEQVAMEAVRCGAQDYLVKGQTDARSIVRAIQYAMDRKRAEEDLRGANEELEQRVQERTADLSHTVETLRDEVARRILAEQTLRQRSEQLRLLASELTLAEQRERQRLAQVLHDGLQQLLVGAKFRLGVLERAKDPAVRKAASEVSDLVSESIESSRSLTAELSPPILHDGGLIPALEWLVRWMLDKHGLIVDLRACCQIGPAEEDVVVLLFQAARELLFNVVKHAGVKAARMEVTRPKDRIQIVVADEGYGFDPAQLRAEGGSAGGFGLFSILERLDLLGGRMEIDSAPGRGSRFTLVAPLPGPACGDAPPVDRQPIVSVGLVARRRKTNSDGLPDRIGVMLVDDHVVMRQGLAGLLREEPDMEIVGEATDGESAVSLARRIRPDVVLMDISMAGMTGVEATRAILAEVPDTQIIGLSMFEEAERAQAMRQAGAAAYLTKSGPSEAVIAAIRTCAAASRAKPAPKPAHPRRAPSADHKPSPKPHKKPPAVK